MQHRLIFQSLNRLFLFVGYVFLAAFPYTVIAQHHNHANEHMHQQSITHLIQNFEDSSRNATQKPSEIIRKMGDISQKTIIDIGCGSGYLATYLARAGANVICADINDAMLEYTERKMDSLNLNVEIRKIPEDFCGLIPNEADAAILLNTYHHIENRVAYFSELNDLLKDGGQVFIVDFFKKELSFGPPVSMKLSELQVASELKKAGYEIADTDTTTLPYQYIITANKKKMKKIKIEIWSDMVCPFCFIGKKKLEQAIEKVGVKDQVEIIWHSYQLDPDFPMDIATSATQTLIEKKGISENQLRGMYQNLVTNGNNYGIDFQFDKCLTFNTLPAHRLWHWTVTHHKENQWKEAVMTAYFTLGTDLSKKENLLKLVSQIGLNPEEAEEILASNQYLEQVQQDIYQSRTIGISGVPYFLFNDLYSVSGAQDDAVFEGVLRKVLGR